MDVNANGSLSGLTLDESEAAAVQRECFDNGLIVEVSGRDDEVVKLRPPLNVDDTLKAGFEIVRVATLGTEPVAS